MAFGAVSAAAKVPRRSALEHPLVFDKAVLMDHQARSESHFCFYSA